MTLQERILQLSAIPAVSGDEQALWHFLAEEAAAMGHTVHRSKLGSDAMGNLIIDVKGARRPGRKLMITAHMDEIGMMITHIDDDGFLHFDTVGNIDRRTLIGKRVLVNNLPGVIGIKAIHMVSQEERKKTPALQDLYIDIGAENKAAAQKLVSLGNVVHFTREAGYTWGAFGEDLVQGPALSSRVPCAVLLQLLSLSSPVDYTAVFSTQKEVGNRGIFGAAFRNHPDVALVLDSCPATDVPGMSSTSSGLALRAGVGISLRDSRALFNTEMVGTLLKLATDNDISACLLTQSPESQAGNLQRTREGIQVAAIRVPVRYLGSPINVAAPADAQAALTLVTSYLNTLEATV